MGGSGPGVPKKPLHGLCHVLHKSHILHSNVGSRGIGLHFTRVCAPTLFLVGVPHSHTPNVEPGRETPRLTLHVPFLGVCVDLLSHCRSTAPQRTRPCCPLCPTTAWPTSHSSAAAGLLTSRHYSTPTSRCVGTIPPPCEWHAV